VGWFPAIQNFNEILIHLNGLRYPWDYLRALKYKNLKLKCLSIKSVAVLPEYWDTGIAILLFAEMAQRAIAKGYQWADLSLTGEDNPIHGSLPSTWKQESINAIGFIKRNLNKLRSYGFGVLSKIILQQSIPREPLDEELLQSILPSLTFHPLPSSDFYRINISQWDYPNLPKINYSSHKMLVKFYINLHCVICPKKYNTQTGGEGVKNALAVFNNIPQRKLCSSNDYNSDSFMLLLQ